MAMGEVAVTEVSTSGVDPAVRVLNVLGDEGIIPCRVNSARNLAGAVGPEAERGKQGRQVNPLANFGNHSRRLMDMSCDLPIIDHRPSKVRRLALPFSPNFRAFCPCQVPCGVYSARDGSPFSLSLTLSPLGLRLHDYGLDEGFPRHLTRSTPSPRGLLRWLRLRLLQLRPSPSFSSAFWTIFVPTPLDLPFLVTTVTTGLPKDSLTTQHIQRPCRGVYSAG